MEADLSRDNVISTFGNIRFDYNAVAHRLDYDYDLIDAHWNLRFRRASVVTGRSFHWCFDGSFVALFPGTVHSPRHDDIHGRERGDFYVR
jgi:hypothetical protein